MSATPIQSDLLNTLKSATATAAEKKEAKKLLKLWYPRMYSLWLEHNS